MLGCGVLRDVVEQEPLNQFFDVERILGLMLNGNNAYALLHMWIFFFSGTFCSFSLYLMH